MGILNSKSSKKQSTSRPKQIFSNDSGEKESGSRGMFVLHRMGSQFFDKDGDMAHEFYEEIKLSDGHMTMQRITTDLRPQGLVTYKHPRLNPDYPLVLV